MAHKLNKLVVALSGVGLIALSQGAGALQFFSTSFSSPTIKTLWPSPKERVVTKDMRQYAKSICMINPEVFGQEDGIQNILDQCSYGEYDEDKDKIRRDLVVGPWSQILIDASAACSLLDFTVVGEVAPEETSAPGMEILGAAVYMRAKVDGDSWVTPWVPLCTNFIGQWAPLQAGVSESGPNGEIVFVGGSLFQVNASFNAAWSNPDPTNLVPRNVSVQVQFKTVAVTPEGPPGPVPVAEAQSEYMGIAGVESMLDRVTVHMESKTGVVVEDLDEDID